ncbi:MAG: phosphoribosylglycinamide formyltransferase [Crocinitomicaceae bacterium]|nr:phosphoribosylglycinamide formyltransferase [Crocinitomicaceae bacterium]
MKNIVIFASGSGSNAENIISYFEHHESINVVAVVCNKPNAGVIDRANKYAVPVIMTNKGDLQSAAFINKLKELEVDLIVLAGFLLLIPESITQAFKMVNVHPSLLPKYGGKGMYGHFVHEAVIKAKEKESGITIHEVNAEYDKGKILFQASCILEEGDTPEALAQKIHTLEHAHFPKVIEKLLLNQQ